MLITIAYRVGSTPHVVTPPALAGLAPGNCPLIVAGTPLTLVGQLPGGESLILAG